MKMRVKSYELRVASWLAMAVVCTMCALTGLGATGESEEFKLVLRCVRWKRFRIAIFVVQSMGSNGWN